MRRVASVLLVATLAVTAACAGDDDPDDAGRVGTQASDAPESTGPAETDETAPAETDGDAEPADETAPAETDGDAEPADEPADDPVAEPADDPIVGDPVVAAELVVTVEQPVDLAARPGDEALYIVGQPGVVTRFDPASGDGTTVLDLGGRTSSEGERGLLGLAFSADGSRAYVNFTDTGGTTTIAEYAVADDGTFDPATERIVLTVEQPYRNHNAGDLAFGPDAMLYIPLGDGGSGGDPDRSANDPTSLLGSLLRLDPTPDGDRAYTVPPDNPFADGPHEGVEGAPEIWAWGLRNPWKIAFDPVTDDLWIADVGQNRWEEINHISSTDERAPGFAADFGWSAFEGTERFNDDVPATEAMVPPVSVYGRSDGCSISGGVPYRGTMIAELEPAYVYSDYCSGTLWALDLAGARTLVLLTDLGAVTAVRAGPDGEIYVLEHGGDVHRLVQG